MGDRVGERATVAIDVGETSVGAGTRVEFGPVQLIVIISKTIIKIKLNLVIVNTKKKM